MIIMQLLSLQPQDWWFNNNRSIIDNAYFENMSRVIVQSGSKWETITERWPNIKKTFENFDINKVACFSDEKIQLLSKEIDIKNSKEKIASIVTNAIRFQIIKNIFGSFQSYIESLNTETNYENAIIDLTNKFENLCHFSASIFLNTIGKKVDPF